MVDMALERLSRSQLVQLDEDRKAAMVSNLLVVLSGAPDGRYVVIQYETAFERKKSAVETITPMVDPDGAWRVSGYYIR